MNLKDYVKQLLEPVENEKDIELIDVEPAFQFSLEDWRDVNE